MIPIALAALACGLAVWVGSASTIRRLRPRPRLPRQMPAPPAALAVGAAAVAVWLFCGPRAGPPAALAAAAGTARLIASLPSRTAVQQDRARAAAVPLLADIAAACVRAGTSLDDAVRAAAYAAGGPLADDVSRAVALSRLGARPEVAWASLLDVQRPPVVRALARAVLRSLRHGAAPGAALAAVADDARLAARTAAEIAARRAGVWAVLPLGLCFLPAFVLIGVAPIALPLLGTVLG